MTLLCLALLASILLGSAELAPAEVWRALTSRDDSTTRSILVSLRIPRVVAASLTGASLAVSGVLFQALLRNPLAEPYLLGVSSGAAFGAVATITLGLGGGGPGLLTLAASLGALAAIGIVSWIARVGERMDTRVLILAGVTVAAFFGAGVMLLLSLARADTFRSAILWTMGSLSGTTWSETAVLAVFGLSATAMAVAMSRDLDALALGEESAAHLGTRVERTKRVAYLLASGLAAVAVSVAGVIGFVGLVVPHAVRLLWGGGHRQLVPICFLAGAVLLLVADTAARTVIRPLEIPVGVVTALVGVPFFLWLLRRNLR